MNPSGLANPAAVRALLDSLGVRPQKRFGQNFLVDRGVVERIRSRVESVHPEWVVEIGPGLGALTQAIVTAAASVLAVEVDPQLAEGLMERLGEPENLTVRTQDFLRLDLAREFQGQRVLVVGSLPYRVTTPILQHLIRHRSVLSEACLITQWEVAEKIAHSPGKHGSALGVFVHAFAHVSELHRIGRGSFFPVPEVDSGLWRMEFLPGPRFRCEESHFFAVVRTLYRNRRKMVRRALRDILPSEVIAGVLGSAAIEETRRGDDLSFEELDGLARWASPWLSTGAPDGDLSE